jgi:hypothetical protein
MASFKEVTEYNPNINDFNSGFSIETPRKNVDKNVF